MNILILTTHLNPGGISRYVITLAEALGGLQHKVWIASSGGEWVNKLENSGIKHEYIPIKTKSICSLKIWKSFFHLKKFIKQEDINVIHANTRVTQFLGFVIYKLMHIPYLSAFHGFYRASTLRRLFKFSGLRTIAVSKAVKEHLINDFGIEQERVRVVYNGLNMREFSKTEVVREDWGFSKSDYLIGILGRISQEKGHLLAVEALVKICPKFRNVYLLISGEGKLKAKLEEKIDSSGIKEYIKFVNCPAGKFLDAVDLLLVPSEKEGFGYSVIEAFAKGVPVIGFNVGGIAEIIQDYRNGILFYDYDSSALAQKIEEVYLDEDLKNRLVTEAKKDVLSFSAEIMAKKVEKLYLEVL